MTGTCLRGRVFGRIPVDPDAPEAQQWLRDELAEAPYQAAQPTWFDRVSQGFFDWLNSLVAPTGEGLGAWLPVLLGAVGAAVLVATLLVFGLPRLNRRSGQDPGLFAGDDRRTADQLRRDARAAAAAGDWNGASEEMFRTITRDLDERTILTATPGTTAHSVALLAASAFPDEGARLAEGARVFDEVRYLGRAGTENGYRLLEELDRDLRDARPTSVAAASSVTAS